MKKTILLTSLLLLSTQANAHEPAPNSPMAEAMKESGVPKWMEFTYHCGIGALIFGGMKHTAGNELAFFSNISDMYMTAFSSMTTDASTPGVCRGLHNKTETALFLRRNINEIEAEIAMGNGEHINSLLSIYNCSEDSKGSIINDLRSNLKKEISSPAYLKYDEPRKTWLYLNEVEKVISLEYKQSCSS